MGFPLPHAEQASLDHLEAVGLQGGQEEEQSIFRGRQGTVFLDGTLARGPGSSIEPPRRHMRLKRRLKRRNQLLGLVQGHPGQIQELCGAGLHISAPYTSHGTNPAKTDSVG
jgi:hypothetical protein